MQSVTKKDLRQFGLIVAGLLAIVFGTVVPWMASHSISKMIWSIAIVLVACALIVPIALYPLYRLFSFVAEILKWVNTRILLTLIYVVLFVPIAALRRCFGKDAMMRQFDRSAKSYRHAAQAESATQMERPF